MLFNEVNYQFKLLIKQHIQLIFHVFFEINLFENIVTKHFLIQK